MANKNQKNQTTTETPVMAKKTKAQKVKDAAKAAEVAAQKETVVVENWFVALRTPWKWTVCIGGAIVILLFLKACF